MQAADDYSRAGHRLAEELEFAVERGKADEALGQAVERVAAVVDALRPLEWEIELVGGSKVRAAATEVVKLVTHARAAAESDALQKGDADAANKAHDAAIKAFDDFNCAARAEIGLELEPLSSPRSGTSS